MLARAIHDSLLAAPEALLAVGFTKKSQVSLAVGREYVIYAVSLWRSLPFFLVVDDKECISWLPAWLFLVVDHSVSAGWICSVFDGEISLVLGPEFIAESEDAYTRLVELDPEQVTRFWQHVQAR